MKAARMHEYGKPPVLEDVPVPGIQPDEILVQVTACGMCRSDVQLMDGYFRKYADIPMPITMGHEITGVVHKIGGIVSKSSGFQEGDHVVVAPGWGDGKLTQNELSIDDAIGRPERRSGSGYRRLHRREQFRSR
jgi:alcohol dehydrogenase, propanol-preferring